MNKNERLETTNVTELYSQYLAKKQIFVKAVKSTFNFNEVKLPDFLGNQDIQIRYETSLEKLRDFYAYLLRLNESLFKSNNCLNLKFENVYESKSIKLLMEDIVTRVTQFKLMDLKKEILDLELILKSQAPELFENKNDQGKEGPTDPEIPFEL